jgi:hypothetical protein
MEADESRRERARWIHRAPQIGPANTPINDGADDGPAVIPFSRARLRRQNNKHQ